MRCIFLILLLLPGYLLSAQSSITFNYDDGETDSLPRFEKLEMHELYPLSRGFCFDRGELTLPDRYVAEGSEGYRDGRSPLRVAGGTLQKNSYLADILGWRMSRYPEEVLTLRPFFSAEPGENPGVARRRGEGVAAWLVREWGIPFDRLRIADPVQIDCRGKDSTCPEDARFVGIESSGPRLTAPIEIHDVRYFGLQTGVSFALNPPDVEQFDRMWVEWYRGSRLVVSKELKEESREWKGRMAWGDTLVMAGDDLPPGAIPIRVTIWGQSGRNKEIELRSYTYDSGTISIISHRDNPRVTRCFGKDRISRYMVPLPARDSSGLSPEGMLFLREVVAKIEDSVTSVTITGYVSQGEEQRTGEMRAAQVAEALRELRPDLAPIIKTAPTEPQMILYRQDSPEGRMHNRTVQIILRSPFDLTAPASSSSGADRTPAADRSDGR